VDNDQLLCADPCCDLCRKGFKLWPAVDVPGVHSCLYFTEDELRAIGLNDKEIKALDGKGWETN